MPALAREEEETGAEGCTITPPPVFHERGAAWPRCAAQQL